MSTETDYNESTTSFSEFLSGSGRKPGGVSNLRLVPKPSDPSPTCSCDDDHYNPSRGIALGLLMATPFWFVLYLVVRRLM